jgi:hypothetical protein
LMRKLYGFFLGCSFAIGVCLAASESAWFPWPNLGGVAMVALAALGGKYALV